MSIHVNPLATIFIRLTLIALSRTLKKVYKVHTFVDDTTLPYLITFLLYLQTYRSNGLCLVSNRKLIAIRYVYYETFMRAIIFIFPPVHHGHER